MEKKVLKDMPALDIINADKLVETTDNSYISQDFGYLNDVRKTLGNLLSMNQPYRVHEGRISLVDKGYIHILVNLTEYTVTSEHSLIIFPESIVQVIEYSDDLKGRGLAATSDFVQFAENEDFFRHYLTNDTNTVIDLDDIDYMNMDQYFKLIWNIVRKGEFRREIIQHILMSLLFYYDDLRKRNSIKESEHITRGQEVFRRFIDLVNQNSKIQRTVNFYADKLCLTPRYLNTLIHQTSGQTMMDWINRSAILEAKVLLKHSNKMIYEIADELNFPSTSFFCKFFKKNTGMTPMEYQKS